jgi:HAD superfamily hydrolase (TIGR01509 family)
MPPAVLLLDVMSTLVSEPFIEAIPEFLGMSLEELRAKKDPEAFLDFERGLIGEQEYGQRFFLAPEPLDVEGMKDTLRRSARLLPGVEDALGRVRDTGVPMYALSNYSEWYAVIDEATGLSRYLDWRYVSCHTGVRKPDPEAYLRPIRELGGLPSRFLFVDDRPINVEGARRCGMQVLLRTPEMDLGSAFESLGVL